MPDIKGGISGLFNRALGRNTLTLGDLMSIDQKRIDKSNNCQVSLVKVYHLLKPESLLDKFRKLFLNKTVIKMYRLIFKFKVTSDSGNSYDVLIMLSPDFDMTNINQNRVKVYCSCNDFKYRSAYNLSKTNSLIINDRIETNLGEALTNIPKKMSSNPICKHCYSAIQYIIKNYQSLMQTI